MAELRTHEHPGESGFRIALVLITLLGAALRLVHLDGTIGFDEAASVRRFVQGGPPAIFGLYSGYGGATSNHLVNSLLAHASARAFGPEVWALRLPAFLFGVAVVPLLGLLARRLVRDPLSGIVAAFLAAVAPILVAYSPACRGYATLLFFVLASVWLVLVVLERGRVSVLLALVLCLLLVGWSHLSGIVFLGVLGLALGALWIRRLRSAEGNAGPVLRAILAVGVATVGLVAWYSRGASLVHDVGTKLTTGEFQNPSLTGLKSMVTSGTEAWFTMTSRHFLGDVGEWEVAIWALAVLGAVVTARRHALGGWLCFAVVLLTPLALVAGRMQPVPRYFLFVQPFLLVWIGAGIAAVARAGASALGRPASGAVWLATLLAGVVASASFPFLRSELEAPGTFFMGIRRDVQGAVDYVAGELEPEDVVVGFHTDDPGANFGLRGFWQVFGFHELLRLAPILSGPGESSDPGAGRRTVWYVTPEGRELTAAELPRLPGEVRLKRVAERVGCRVYRAEVSEPAARPQDLPAFPRSAEPEPAPGTPRSEWTFHDPFGGATCDLADASQQRERATIQALWSGAVGELVSPPVPLGDARLVEVSGEIECDQSDGLRPFGRIVLLFRDDAGAVLGEVSRMALEWPGRVPSSQPARLRSTTLVPRGARTLEVRLGLADGTHTGDRVTFRLPRLWLR